MGRDIKLMTGTKGHELFISAMEKQALASLEQDMANHLMFGDRPFKTTETKLLELPEVIKMIPTKQYDKIIQLAGSKMEDDQNLARALITKYVSNLNEIAEKAKIPLKEEELFSNGIFQQMQQASKAVHVANPLQSFKYVVMDYSDEAEKANGGKPVVMFDSSNLSSFTGDQI